jgi:hypothetical protein
MGEALPSRFSDKLLEQLRAGTGFAWAAAQRESALKSGGLFCMEAIHEDFTGT